MGTQLPILQMEYTPSTYVCCVYGWLDQDAIWYGGRQVGLALVWRICCLFCDLLRQMSRLWTVMVACDVKQHFSVWITADEDGYFALIGLHWRQINNQSIYAAK